MSSGAYNVEVCHRGFPLRIKEGREPVHFRVAEASAGRGMALPFGSAPVTGRSPAQYRRQRFEAALPRPVWTGSVCPSHFILASVPLRLLDWRQPRTYTGMLNAASSARLASLSAFTSCTLTRSVPAFSYTLNFRG